MQVWLHWPSDCGSRGVKSEEAQCFFQKHGVQLPLTIAHNPEANGKIELGHSPIIRALIKACDGKV
jgi:hypothetical protein